MNIIEQIKQLRAAFESAVQKFADYKVGEMTVRIEGEPVVGAAVTLLDADGNPIDATGTHAIPSLGTVVVANGVIESITPEEVVVEAAETPAEAVAEVIEVATELAPEASTEAVAEVSAEVVAEIMEKLGAMEEVIVEMKKKMSAYGEREKQMFALIEQLSGLPTAPEKPQTFAGQFKKAEADRFEKLAETLKTLKIK